MFKRDTLVIDELARVWLCRGIAKCRVIVERIARRNFVSVTSHSFTHVGVAGGGIGVGLSISVFLGFCDVVMPIGIFAFEKWILLQLSFDIIR